MTTYRSLVGGFYANPDKDTDLPASIRYNNPGAINAVAWVQSSPGYVHSVVIKGNNPIAVFETPEQGVALWYELLVKYRKSGAVTLNQIITRYGGNQNYSAYVQTVAAWADMVPDTLIDLENDDQLLAFAHGMFRYEAGKPSPLTDKQILYGFEIARGHAPEQPKAESFIDWLIELIKAFLNLWHVPQPKPKPKNGAPWVDEVRRNTGIKETPGSGNTPAILAWRNDIAKAFPEMADYAATYTADSIPWCGFGLGAAMCRAGIRPPFGKEATDKFMWADAWSRWGTKLAKPIPGCIMVFTRDGGGHVGMLEKIDGSKLWVRGYNQSDEVDVSTRMLNSTFTAAVWPTGYPVMDVEPDISNAVQAGKES